MFFSRHKTSMPEPGQALPGREHPIASPGKHVVLGNPTTPPWPEGFESLVVGMGCFWGAERVFWTAPGVYTTAVGYAGGSTPNPTYEEVCSARTGHTEVVLVVHDPVRLPTEELLRAFWEGHDPTQGNRQGNDVGSQYRSIVLTHSEEQAEIAAGAKARYQEALAAAGHRSPITTEIEPAGEFFYAEDYHQQYLHKVPNGYCGLGGTGVSCPVGLTPAT